MDIVIYHHHFRVEETEKEICPRPHRQEELLYVLFNFSPQIYSNSKNQALSNNNTHLHYESVYF